MSISHPVLRMVGLALLSGALRAEQGVEPRYAGRWRLTWTDQHGSWSAASTVTREGTFHSITTGPGSFRLEDHGTITARDGRVSWRSSTGPGRDEGTYRYDERGDLVVTSVTGITTHWTRLPVAPAAAGHGSNPAPDGTAGPWVGTWSLDVTLQGKSYRMYMRLDDAQQYRSWATQGTQVMPGASGRYRVEGGRLRIEKTDGTRMEAGLELEGSDALRLVKASGSAQRWRRETSDVASPGEAGAGAGFSEADRQDPALCYAEGERLYRLEEMKPAFEWFLRAAQLGHGRAQLQVGWHLEKGIGAPLDLTRAAEWYRKAADGGDAQATGNLGHMLEIGTGIQEDWVAAAGWYAKGAALGDARCQASLARAYRFGIGVAQDRQQAIAWYLKAAQQGDEESADDARWLRDPTNNVGFRNAAEKERVMGGMLPISNALWGADPVGKLLFRQLMEAPASGSVRLRPGRRTPGASRSWTGPSPVRVRVQ